MDTKLKFEAFGGNFVYVKPVVTADLPDEVQQKAGELTELFAVHNADGRQLALVADRKLAFALAKQNNMQPLTLH